MPKSVALQGRLQLRTDGVSTKPWLTNSAVATVAWVGAPIRPRQSGRAGRNGCQATTLLSTACRTEVVERRYDGVGIASHAPSWRPPPMVWRDHGPVGGWMGRLALAGISAIRLGAPSRQKGWGTTALPPAFPALPARLASTFRLAMASRIAGRALHMNVMRGHRTAVVTLRLWHKRVTLRSEIDFGKT